LPLSWSKTRQRKGRWYSSNRFESAPAQKSSISFGKNRYASSYGNQVVRSSELQNKFSNL